MLNERGRLWAMDGGGLVRSDLVKDFRPTSGKTLFLMSGGVESPTRKQNEYNLPRAGGASRKAPQVPLILHLAFRLTGARLLSSYQMKAKIELPAHSLPAMQDVGVLNDRDKARRAALAKLTLDEQDDMSAAEFEQFLRDECARKK